MTLVHGSTECAKSARAACFVRYKEKKQNRKSGKIRYEMRKLNAEKRPRIRVRTSTPGVTQNLSQRHASSAVDAYMN